MSRIILPGEAQRAKGGMQIYVPGEYASRVEAGELIGYCRVCGAEFFQGQEATWQRHVGECARENMDELIAESPRTKMPLFQPEAWDPELERHLSKVGKQMLKEGRFESKPSERANG